MFFNNGVLTVERAKTNIYNSFLENFCLFYAMQTVVTI